MRRLAHSTSQKRDGLLPNFVQFGRTYAAFAGSVLGLPVQAFDLIGERHTGLCSRKANLKGVILDLRGSGAAQQEPGSPIVRGGAQYHGGPVSSLLLARGCRRGT
jgi:hypothetical protein